VVGVELDSGEYIPVDPVRGAVVSAVGPWTESLLSQSGIDLPPEEKRPIATSLLAFYLELNPGPQLDTWLGKMPVSFENGADIMPPIKPGDLPKLNWIGTSVVNVPEQAETATATAAAGEQQQDPAVVSPPETPAPQADSKPLSQTRGISVPKDFSSSAHAVREMLRAAKHIRTVSLPRSEFRLTKMCLHNVKSTCRLFVALG
jgi:hypothetical protein